MRGKIKRICLLMLGVTLFEVGLFTIFEVLPKYETFPVSFAYVNVGLFGLISCLAGFFCFGCTFANWVDGY